MLQIPRKICIVLFSHSHCLLLYSTGFVVYSISKLTFSQYRFILQRLVKMYCYFPTEAISVCVFLQQLGVTRLSLHQCECVGFSLPLNIHDDFESFSCILGSSANQRHTDVATHIWLILKLSYMCTRVCTFLQSRKSYLNIAPPTVCAYCIRIHFCVVESPLLGRQMFTVCQTVHLMHHFHMFVFMFTMHTADSFSLFFLRLSDSLHFLCMFAEVSPHFHFLLLRDCLRKFFTLFNHEDLRPSKHLTDSSVQALATKFYFPQNRNPTGSGIFASISSQGKEYRNSKSFHPEP